MSYRSWLKKERHGEAELATTLRGPWRPGLSANWRQKHPGWEYGNKLSTAAAKAPRYDRHGRQREA
jgi:hypothetical protein